MPTKIFPSIGILLIASLACSLPGSILGPTLTPTPTQTVTPTATTYSQYSYWEVPIQAVLVSDDDGSHAVQITYEEIKIWVDRTNFIYAPAGIRFLFQPADMSTMNSTLLNNMIDNQDAQWDAEVVMGNQVAAQHPGKLTIFFRRGSEEYWLGGAFSSANYNFVVMPQYSDTGCDNQDDHGMLAHELGHYLGLAHTFAMFNTVSDAEQFLKDHNNDPNVFDVDGLSDTLPDPYIGGNSCTDISSVTLNHISFTLPRDNIMTYYNGRSSLSPMQMENARWFLKQRMQNAMAMPTNINAPNPLEAQNLGIWSISGCSSIYQDMSGFGDAPRWYHDDQLFVSSGHHCSITLGLPVAVAGRYRLDVYLTIAPDFGQLQALLDGVPAGGPIELFAPGVLPTGPISLGTFDLAKKTHSLTFQVIGKDIRSPYYSFGLDCFSLVPVP